VLQQAAPPCWSIKIVTGLVLLLAAGLGIAAFREPSLMPIVLILLFSVGIAYLLSPVGYEVAHGVLTVERRWGNKEFGPVVRCSIPEERPRSITLRLWGNGGLFSGTGIFWNRRWGIFRAYVTRTRHDELVLVETMDGRKVLISPEDPAAFVRDAGS
jgi:hypothetical protein